jgi:hypothetical protein
MLTLFFLLEAVLFSHSAQAQLLPPPAPGEYQLRGEFSYFDTHINFGDDGSKATLADGASLNTMMGLGEFIFDWTEHLRLRAGLTGGQTEAHRLEAPNNVLERHTNVGLSEIWAGGEYWYHLAPFDLVPAVEVYYPLFRVDTASGDPLLGEGATRVRGGAWLVLDWGGDFRPFGYLGYEFRDEGRSALLPYHGGIQWLTEAGTWAQIELRGYQKLTDDSNSDAGEERSEYLTRVQGGSERFYSLNPSLHEVAVLAGTHFGQMGVYGGVSYAYMGKNNAEGVTYTVGVSFDGSFFTPTPQPEVIRYENKFEVKQETYDPSLFQTSPVPARKAVKRKAPPATKGPMPTVELMMKNTEKALESKDKKDKKGH